MLAYSRCIRSWYVDFHVFKEHYPHSSNQFVKLYIHYCTNSQISATPSEIGARAQTTNSTKVRWIEKLLETPVDDYRKFAVWRILAPYLINIRKYSQKRLYNIIQNWLNRCSPRRRLDFSPNYMIKYDINTAKRSGYLPISLEKLKIENSYLYNVLAKS